MLDPLRVPLHGSRLVEASAGTGKTWTLAALYLRLVLGHGDGGTAFSKPLAPSEILVLTFTRAATRELSDRIRRRLIEAAEVFRADNAAAPRADPLLAGLLAAHPEGPARAQAAWRLATAAEGMDDAAIHTIDAWCQRMLREHAFDSGSLFDEELLADEAGLLQEAVQDHWRQQVYPLSGEALERVLSVWPAVESLQADVQSFLAHRDDLPPWSRPGETLAELLQRFADTEAAELAALKHGWADRARDMKRWVEQHLAADDCPFDKKKVQPRYHPAWLEALAAWADSPEPQAPPLTDTARERLQPDGLRACLKPGCESLALHEGFALFAQLIEALALRPRLETTLRWHAATQVAERLAELKRQAGVHGFADMLSRLDEALRGSNAARLRERIRAQFPAALIDEFQDTSPVQARIFDSLYHLTEDDPASAVFLIGDPKQSIYGFRGADIHSYLTARRATAGRHEVLGTNHRAVPGLVDAVNRLFLQAEARPGEGAFMFRTAQEDALPFVPVQARGRPERFVTSGAPVPALTWAFDPEPRGRSATLRVFAARCAQQVIAWLNDPAAGFEGAAGTFQRLRPADIAVLVRNRREAEAVRRELRQRQLASVFLSDQNSVFDTREAQDLLRWLRAVAEPQDSRLVRAALATATVGLGLAELRALARSDDAFELRAGQFRQLRLTWLAQGVLTMLRQTLHLLALPARWLREPDGERRLTNFLHLAELLQDASARLEGEQAQVRWLALQIEHRSAARDEQIVRLESDADLVQVVTVHKSKGLEYPLVLLPFACSARPVDARRHRLSVQVDDAGQRHLQMQPTPQTLAAADKERHREDLRLLYVALTRARHAVWAGVAIVQPGNRKDNELSLTALGYLLTGPDKALPADVQRALQVHAEASASVRVELADAPAGSTPWRSPHTVRPLQSPPPYAADFERRWGIGSFSALVRDIPSAGLKALAAVVREDELLHADGLRPSPPAVLASPMPWHAFPRGAMPGNFLHDQLEWLADEGFALDTSPTLRQQLLRRCERQGYGERGEEVLAWLREVVSRPLPSLGVPLSALATRLPEMEFWLPSAGLRSAEVDALCRAHLLNGRERPALPQRELRGMVMGFADLVFEHGGRYWVLDYKSNHLGMRDSDYHSDALEAAMAAHRYDVQAGLYLLALHRLLRSRLGDAYRPAQHLGGAVYLFLRGIHGPEGGCHLVPADALFLDAIDALTLGEGPP